MDPIDTSNSDAEQINLHDSFEGRKVAQRLESQYTRGAPEDASRVVRARQIAARAFCKLDQGDIAGGKEDLREVMQFLDGELEAGR